MLDPHYSVRPQNGRHPFGQKTEKQRQGHISVVRNDLPGIAAHRGAKGPKRACCLITSTGLDLRTRIPLARSAASCAAPSLKKQNCKAVPYGPVKSDPANYLTSTLAPTSSNFFLMVAASSLLTPSLTVFGAPSTRSLASFKPRLVTSRTALMTLILLPPTSVSTTANSVFSSAGAAAAAPPPPPATTVAAAAETPKVSSIFLTRSDASSSVSPLISSRIVSTFAMTVPSPLEIKISYWAASGLGAGVASTGCASAG